MSVGHSLPLQLRLIATVAAALLITATLSVVPVYWHAKSKVATEMQAALAVGERVAVNEIQTIESARNVSQRLELMVAHFHGDRHLKASLVNAAGRPISSSRLAPPDETAPHWFARFIGAEPLTKAIPITPPAPPLTAVVIEADPTNEVAEAWTDLMTFAAILGLFCILVLALVSWIVTRAIRPIQSLLIGYSEVGSGNLAARVVPSGSPELERLCLGFNDMGNELQRMAERNARLTQQLEEVQEEERADLARDLHDEVSPLLFAADVDATMIAKLARTDGKEEIVAQTESIRSALKQLKKIVTLILGRLRPAILLDQGLSVAIDNLVSSCRQRHPDV
ncbi:MAG: HAMP domain-containing protein, partial [Alphaproteobacteria bacterium]|nr:HAMP domain-containing protein [Alphaproteobacteria bacterium]